MTAQPELDLLKRYAEAANAKVMTTQADLDPKDHIMLEMLDWCIEHQGIVVLKSGMILTSDPISRNVQNCKAVMINKGIRPGRVVAATPALITILLGNVDHEALEKREEDAIDEEVSKQQKRLRILIQEAVDMNISDIHIEVREEIARIRFRKHGEMYLHAEWFPKIAREVASVAFNKETDHATAHFNPMIPQNASMPMEIDGQDIRLRLASLPAHGGFDMVMRILGTGEKEERTPSLEELGYTAAQIAIIKKSLKEPHGAVLMAGPTGSGKTTTLASCMTLFPPERKVYTIEDPVEKFIDNATQVPVNTDKDNRSFASFGRACLRMDPDVIVLGEMRDEDTAGVMVRAAITGHLVFSTIHTNSAPNIITRLTDLNISPILLADGSLLVCLVYQRLVPVLCKHCKKHVSESQLHAPSLQRWQAYFADNFEQVMVRGGVDCEYCKSLGVTGRTVAAEVIWIDDKGREFIQNRDTFGWEQYLRANGWQTHKDHALQLVANGTSDPLDVEKVIGEINSAFTTENFDYRQAG